MVTLPTHTPVRLGIDFTGGTFLQYGFQKKLSVPEIRNVLVKAGQENPIIQIQEPTEILGSLSEVNKKPVSQGETTLENENSSKKADSENASNTNDNEKTNENVDEKVPTESENNVSNDVSKQQENKDLKENKTPETSQTNENKSSNTEKTFAEETNEQSPESKILDNDKKPAANNIMNENIDQESISTTQTLDPEKVKTIVSMRVKFLSDKEVKEVNKYLRDNFGDFSIIQVSAIGPSLGKELLQNAMMALLLVFGGIVVYLTIRFQLDYAVCALISLFHDAIFVIGIFSLFGLLFKTEIDSMFVTAVLTVIGFSVHDTIVVYDRIRENARFLSKKKTFNEICNDSVNQTLARSINTSLTTLFVLLCLYFFGGVTTKDFVLAMTIGIAVGTYSSIFVASVLLAYWRDINAPKTKRRKVTT